MLPVIIQDLIQKVSDQKVNVEKRQHYAATLREIVKASEQALAIYDLNHKQFNDR